MSAPNQGRQSPEPKEQTKNQLHQPPASDPNKQNVSPGDNAADASKEQLKNLESNPKGPLQDEAAKKTT